MLLQRYVCNPLALAGFLAILVVGCIVSGQFVIVINIEDEVAYVNNILSSAEVDLTDDDTWKKHKDDIQNIVDVKFEMTIKNDSATVASGQVYVSKSEYDDADSVKAKATLVLSGMMVKGGESRKIKFAESAQFITDLDKLLELVETGQFYVYALAEQPPFVIRVLAGSRLLVTFSAG